MIKNLFSVLLVLFVALSCQEDSMTEDTVALTNTSDLTAMLKSMSVNDTGIDDIIDNNGCFKVKLPVIVTVNSIQILLEDENDYVLVKNIMDLSDEDSDDVIFSYPITLELADYSTVTINDAEEFEVLTRECTEVNEIGDDCVSMVYPIIVNSYNSGFQMEKSTTVNNNEQLYLLLKGLQENDYYAIRYPVSLNIKDGPALTVNANAALSDAVNNAIDACKQGGCSNPAILTNGLLVYMPFSNGEVKDLKKNELTGIDGFTFTTDRDGNQNCAVVFNGSQSFTIAGNSANKIVNGDSFSISLWFRMQNTNSNNLEQFFAKGTTAESGFSLSAFSLNAPVFTSGTLELEDIAWKTSASLPVDTAEWHHLVLTVSANAVNLYRDGLLQNSSASEGLDLGTTSLDYVVGAGFNGFMDDLRVYKKVLSPQEVEILYELNGDCNTCLE